MSTPQPSDSLELSADWLAGLGYGSLTPRQTVTVLRRAYEALESMVGEQLTSQLTDRQLDEFAQYFDNGNEQASLEFLRSNASDYRTVVRIVHRSLEDALREAALRYSDSTILDSDRPAYAKSQRQGED